MKKYVRWWKGDLYLSISMFNIQIRDPILKTYENKKAIKAIFYG